MKLKVILVSEAIRKSSKNEKLLGIYLSNKVRFNIYIWYIYTHRESMADANKENGNR